MQEYYGKLLEIQTAENMEEKEIEWKVDKFQEIIEQGKADQKIITTTEIRKAIKGMKNKKVGEKNNWKAKWIKEGDWYWAGFPIVGGAWAPHLMIFFKTPPPTKTDTPPWGNPPPLKNEAPPIWKTTPHPLKHETPFYEMIPWKSTINNTLKSG